MPIYVPATNTGAEIARLGKPPVEVAADYIRSIFQHAWERIAINTLETYLENNLRLKFVLTVLAVGSDKAKDATEPASKLGGMFPVTSIKEPEAAAVYTLHVPQDRGWEMGEALVICDAGGDSGLDL